LRAFQWDGHQLTAAFEVDFIKEQLGRPHHMKFTANPQRVASLLRASVR
jgi:selenium-binding protein 1